MSKTGPNSRGSMANKIKKYKFDVEIVQKELVIWIVNCTIINLKLIFKSLRKKLYQIQIKQNHMTQYNQILKI